MISYETQGGAGPRFDFRAAGVCLYNAHVLAQTADTMDFHVLPGGRVEAGEESGTALDRELTEELDRDFHVGDLLRVVENFFRLGERDYHELSLIYRITPANPEVLDTDWPLRRTPPGEKHVLDFHWLPPDDLNHHTLKPEWLISRLSDLPRETTHVIVRE